MGYGGVGPGVVGNGCVTTAGGGTARRACRLLALRRVGDGIDGGRCASGTANRNRISSQCECRLQRRAGPTGDGDDAHLSMFFSVCNPVRSSGSTASASAMNRVVEGWQ
jgi:hypothetical protein